MEVRATHTVNMHRKENLVKFGQFGRYMVLGGELLKQLSAEHAACRLSGVLEVRGEIR